MKNKKGFTLIELLVVISIIGVLTLLGFRLYTNQQVKAKNAIVKANAGTIQTLLQANMADTDYIQGAAGDRVSQALTDISNAGGCNNPYTGGTGASTIKECEENLVGGVFTDRGKVAVAAPNINEFRIQGLDQNGELFGNELVAKK